MKKITSRRNFIKQTLSGVTMMSLPLGTMSSLAQVNGDYKALVCVYLYGGNDSENTIIPLSGTATDHYAAERQGNFDLRAASLPIGSSYHNGYGQTVSWGLHPSLSGIANLQRQGKVAVVANVGTLVQPLTQSQYRGSAVRPDKLFSHSDQQAQTQNGIPNGNSSSGWGGRIADSLYDYNNNANFPATASLSGSSIMVAGMQTEAATLSPGYNLSLTTSYNDGATAARNKAIEALLARDTGNALTTRANHKILEGLDIGSILEQAKSSTPPLATTFPATSIGGQLREVAYLIKMHPYLGVRRQVFFVSLGGFDTHSNQVTLQAGLLTQLDQAIAAFQSEIESQGNSGAITTFTMSDFNRTLTTNSNRGTDHAWGGHHFVIGGAVKGGFYGKFPVLLKNGPDSTDVRGRWIPTTAVDQYGATLAKWLGVTDMDLPMVFPNINNFSNWNLNFFR